MEDMVLRDLEILAKERKEDVSTYDYSKSCEDRY